jgi:hypothetical protein
VSFITVNFPTVANRALYHYELPKVALQFSAISQSRVMMALHLCDSLGLWQLKKASVSYRYSENGQWPCFKTALIIHSLFIDVTEVKSSRIEISTKKLRQRTFIGLSMAFLKYHRNLNR